MVDTLLSKGRVLLIHCRRGRSNLLSSLVYNALYMLLLDCLARHPERPAISCRHVLVESPRLSLIGVRARKVAMLFACVIVLKPLLMRSKGIGGRVEKVLCFIEVARLVECRGAGVDSVGF